MTSGLRPSDAVKISKTVSYILRHGAEKEGFQLMPGGFLYVEDILKKKRFHTVVTIEDIQAIVENDNKQRYTLVMDEATQKLKIRANQGHSLAVEGLDLTSIETAEEYPIVVHGTYHKYWPSIAKEGLKRMNRNHIHFAAGMPNQDGVISGMRSSCQVVIFLNLTKALQDGLKFYLSANNVILSSGDKTGAINPRYFYKVVDRRTGKKLAYEGSSEDGASPTAGETDGMGEVVTGAQCMAVTAVDIAEEYYTKSKSKKKGEDDSTNQEGSGCTIVSAEDLDAEYERKGRRKNKKRNQVNNS